MNYLSLSCVKLSVFNDQNTQIDVATGFFYENEKGSPFIITNWHVVTGRRPESPKTSKTGAVPTRISFERPKAEGEGIQAVLNMKDLRTIDVTINTPCGENPTWLETPQFGPRVDVVAVPIVSINELEQICPIHMLNKCPDFEPRFSPNVMDDVSVIGFPWGLSVGGTLPIYKRGSVASEPRYNQQRLPRFLIDCRTAPSMSGSPVLASSSGIWTPPGESKLSGNSVIGTVNNFVGVYSGRLTPSELGGHGGDETTELGIVWRKDVLEIIVNKGVPGSPLSKLA